VWERQPHHTPENTLSRPIFKSHAREGGHLPLLMYKTRFGGYWHSKKRQVAISCVNCRPGSGQLKLQNDHGDVRNHFVIQKPPIYRDEESRKMKATKNICW
jgi:hypothetical protein